MSKREEILVNLSIKLKKEYMSVKWWKFNKKSKAYNKWQNTLQLLYKTN